MAPFAHGLGVEAASAAFYRGQLLNSVLLSPVGFLDAIVPLYNALNGAYVIEGVKVEYSQALFDAVHGSEPVGGSEALA